MAHLDRIVVAVFSITAAILVGGAVVNFLTYIHCNVILETLK